MATFKVMAQLAGSASIMDEFNSAFRQCMPPPHFQFNAAAPPAGGAAAYTPSLLDTPPTVQLQAPAHAPCLAQSQPPAAKRGGALWLKALGWLGVAVAGVIIIAIFLRRRTFVRVENNPVMPLIADSLEEYMNVRAAPKPRRVVEVVEEVEEEEPADRIELIEENTTQRKVHFEDEDNAVQAPLQSEEHEQPPLDEEVEEDDPNFTPMKLDML